jgi:hydrogenase-1 operon protein HyaE
MIEQQTFHPLVARLVSELNYPLISDQASLDAFINHPDNRVLFCGGDPKPYPECLDVAVVLPELDRAMQGKVHFAVCSREMDESMKMKYGFNVWPTLVFIRGGEYVGIISGIKDWVDYLEQCSKLLDYPTSRPPSIGISISAPSSASCH